MVLGDALSEPLSDFRALLGGQRDEPADPVGELSRILSAEALSRVEQRVEHRIRGQHGDARGSRLEDDLVGGTCTHVVHEGVVVREQRGDLRARHRVPQPRAPVQRELGGKALELRPMLALLLGERRPVDVEHDAVTDRGKRTKHDVESLCRRVPAQREQPEVVGRLLAVRARELGQVDAMPDRPQLPGLEREGPAVDRHHGRRDAFGRAEQATRSPVREPEDERYSQRPDERRGQYRVDRAHVRNDRAAA